MDNSINAQCLIQLFHCPPFINTKYFVVTPCNNSLRISHNLPTLIRKWRAVMNQNALLCIPSKIDCLLVNAECLYNIVHNATITARPPTHRMLGCDDIGAAPKNAQFAHVSEPVSPWIEKLWIP